MTLLFANVSGVCMAWYEAHNFLQKCYISLIDHTTISVFVVLLLLPFRERENFIHTDYNLFKIAAPGFISKIFLQFTELQPRYSYKVFSYIKQQCMRMQFSPTNKQTHSRKILPMLITCSV